MSKKQRKWATEMHAYADGEDIEFKYVGLDPFYKTEFKDWKPVSYPQWNDEYWEFRIKQQPKEPQYLYVYQGGLGDSILFATVSPKNGSLNTRDFPCIGRIKLEDVE